MLDMKVTENCSLHKNYCLLKLTSDQILPEMLPGQFVQVRVDNSPTTFLRRPISINYVDRATNELWLDVYKRQVRFRHVAGIPGYSAGIL